MEDFNYLSDYITDKSSRIGIAALVGKLSPKTSSHKSGWAYHLANQCLNAGFENVEVIFEKNTLKINLKEYPIVNQLIIIGEKTKNFKNQIKKVINSKENKSLINSNLAKDVNLIKNLYSSSGYNFAKVEAKLKKLTMKITTFYLR